MQRMFRGKNGVAQGPCTGAKARQILSLYVGLKAHSSTDRKPALPKPKGEFLHGLRAHSSET